MSDDELKRDNERLVALTERLRQELAGVSAERDAAINLAKALQLAIAELKDLIGIRGAA